MNGCPSDEELGQFLAESMSAEAAGMFESHLEQCLSCQDRLQNYAARTLEHWREQLEAKRSSAASPELGFLERLANLPPQQILNESSEQRPLGGDLESPERRLTDSRVHGTFATGSNLTNPVWPTIRGYEVLGELGRGGMGVVYKARQIDLKRLVALKMLRVGDRPGADALVRFRREAETVARLQHPNLVQIYEIGWHDGLPYICQEYIDGGNLTERLAGRPQPLHESAGMVETLARAMHYAHTRGIVHRDLKPANVLLQLEDSNEAAVRLSTQFDLRSAIPKIADFGLAKPLDSDVQLTRSGLILGTPSYMAPEQVVVDDTSVGPAVDIYALGSILYEMITGRPPFIGRTPLAIAEQVVRDEPLSPVRQHPEVPRDLETICLKCLEKDPTKRYTTAEELAEDLRRFRAGETLIARPVGWLERGAKWARRRPEQALLASALVIVSCLGVAGMIWQLLRVEAARTSAVQEKEAAEWQSYRANIGAASTAFQLYNYDAAARYLAGAPERHRNWEWKHFVSRFNRAHSALRGHEDVVLGMAFSPDGRLIASCSADRTVRLWDVATESEIARLQGHEDIVKEISFSPDGQRLVSMDKAMKVRLWNPADRSLVAVLACEYSQPQAYAFTFTPDSELVVIPNGTSVYLCDTKTGATRKTLQHPSASIGPVVCTQDGKQLIGAGEDGSLTVWDFESEKITSSWQGHSGRVSALRVSPDGTCLASGGDFPDNTIHLWDLASGQNLATMQGHKNQVACLTFSPDGSRVVSACWDQTARMWNRATGHSIATLQHRGRVTDAAFQPGGTQLMTRGDDQTVRLWDAKTGEPLNVLSGNAGMPGRGIAFSPDGTLLASACDDRSVLLWDFGIVERGGVLRGHTGYVYDVAFSPDDTRVASAAWDGTVRIWDVASQRPVGPPLKHDEAIVGSLVFSRDGKQIVTSTRDHIYLWDLATSQPKYVWRASKRVFGETRAAIHPTGSLVAAISHNASAELWDAASGSAVGVLGEGGKSNDVTFNIDGTELATAELDGTIQLWNPSTGSNVGQLRGHKADAVFVRYSPDGALIATAAQDQTVRLWDATTHTELARLPHGCLIYGLAFTPDCTRLATACQDHTIRLWSIATHQEVAELHGHTDYVHAVAFSSDGTRLVSASGDFTVRIWDTIPPLVRDRIP